MQSSCLEGSLMLKNNDMPSDFIPNIKQETGKDVNEFTATIGTAQKEPRQLVEVKWEEITSKSFYENKDLIKSEEICIKDENQESNFTVNSDENQHKGSAVKTHVHDEHTKRQEQHNKAIKSEVECDFQANYKRTLTSHVRRLYKCEKCGFGTIHKGSFQRHLLRHENPEKVKKFQCQFCNYKSFHKYNFDKHQLTHKTPHEIEATKRFKCNSCNYRTAHKGHLSSHQLTHKNADEVETLQCNHCAYQTFHKFRMKEHLLRHANPEDVKKFQCDFCNYSSFYKRDFNIHQRTHQNSDNVKMYNCVTCKFQTKYKNCIKRHLLRHKSNDNGETDTLS